MEVIVDIFIEIFFFIFVDPILEFIVWGLFGIKPSQKRIQKHIEKLQKQK